MVQTRSAARVAAIITTPHVEQLTDELLLEIFELIKRHSTHDLLAVTLVHKRWHAPAQDVLERSIGPLVLSVPYLDRNRVLFTRLRTNSKFRCRVKHLTVGDWHLRRLDLFVPTTFPRVVPGENPFEGLGYFSPYHKKPPVMNDPAWIQMQNLVHLLPHMRLASFTWSALPLIPQELAVALGTQENCALVVRSNENTRKMLRWSYTGYLNPRFVESMSFFSSTLTSLEVYMPAAEDELMQQLGSTMAKCSVLKTLKIHAIGRVWRPAMVPNALEQTSFNDFTTATSLPELLRPSSVLGAGSLRLKDIAFNNFCICQQHNSELELYLNAVNWGLLQSLEVTCCTLLEYICARATEVSSLRLTLTSGRRCEYGMCKAIRPFSRVSQTLMQLNHLRSLTLINGTHAITQELLVKIGSGLRNLDLHERTECRWPNPDRPVLEADVLQHIRVSCPRLRRLALGAPYSDAPYHSFIDEVSSQFSQLPELAIYREVEAYGTETIEPPRSAVTSDSVREDFLRLQSVMSLLESFEVLVTSMPPFHNDRNRHETYTQVAEYQRHLLVEKSGEGVVVRHIDVERAQRAVQDGATGPSTGFWQRKLGVVDWLAAKGWDFHTSPPQTYGPVYSARLPTLSTNIHDL